jgi:hypothetical protein
MPGLSKGAVKTVVKNMLDDNMTNTNAANSRDAAAQAMADAICEAVKTGIEGSVITLSSPSGPVTGTITLEILP